MRKFVVVIVACAVLAEALPAQQSESASVRAMRRIGSMSQIMVHLIYPTSDAIFYIDTRTPTTDAEWNTLEAQTVMLAESANLLLMPDRIRDEEQWVADATLLLEVGRAALRATRDRDVEALSNLNEQLYQSCVMCHQHYREGYPRRRE